MKNSLKFIIFVVVITTGLFYYFKRDEINNLLDPSNTKIEISEKHFVFGRIKISDTVNHTFFVKNQSSDNLIIKNVQSNCGCTVADFTKEPVKEGDSAKVMVRFIPNKVGKIRKDVLLEANTAPPFTVLSLSGEVVK